MLAGFAVAVWNRPAALDPTPDVLAPEPSWYPIAVPVKPFAGTPFGRLLEGEAGCCAQVAAAKVEAIANAQVRDLMELLMFLQLTLGNLALIVGLKFMSAYFDELTIAYFEYYVC